jgi:hypothetical protein
MLSRAARLTFTGAAWATLAAAALFLALSERHLETRSSRLRAFDLAARQTTDQIAELSASQRAYVAAGQDAAVWTARATELLRETATGIDSLRAAALSGEAAMSLMEGASAVAEITNLDKRAREYLRSQEPLMASDVVFSEGAEAVAAAARHVGRARTAEHQAHDARRLVWRRLQVAVATAAAGLTAVLMTMFALWTPHRGRAETEQSAAATEVPSEPAVSLRIAAELCTDLGRVTDVSTLTHLLGRVADVLGASGVIIWLGTSEERELHPVCAHGYSEQLLARLPRMHESADNATAAAYRTGQLQVVRSAGTSQGALVAPLLTGDGCIGALAAEIADGGEASGQVQALASILAAQLAGLMTLSASGESPSAMPGGKVASA